MCRNSAEENREKVPGKTMRVEVNDGLTELEGYPMGCVE